jgi:hypothetical protein
MSMEQPAHPPLTTQALAAWLRTQPPEDTYTWSDPVFCLLGRYLADHESQWGSAQYSELPAYELIAKSQPHTFGAALARAEKLLALPAPDGAPLISETSDASTEDALVALPPDLELVAAPLALPR